MQILITLANFFGFHFVPENHIVAVMRTGMFHRVMGPGFIWLMPILEQVSRNINIGIRIESLPVKQVLSEDGIPHDVNLTVLYRFDPEIPKKPIAAQLVRCTDAQLNQIVKDFAENTVRLVVGSYEAKEICNGTTAARIQHEVLRTLTPRLRFLGFIIMEREGVMIKDITMPPDFLKTFLEAKRHEITLGILDQYPDSKIDKAVIAEWVNSPDGPNGLPPFLLFSDGWGVSSASKGNGHEASE